MLKVGCSYKSGDDLVVITGTTAIHACGDAYIVDLAGTLHHVSALEVICHPDGSNVRCYDRATSQMYFSNDLDLTTETLWTGLPASPAPAASGMHIAVPMSNFAAATISETKFNSDSWTLPDPPPPPSLCTCGADAARAGDRHALVQHYSWCDAPRRWWVG